MLVYKKEAPILNTLSFGKACNFFGFGFDGSLLNYSSASSRCRTSSIVNLRFGKTALAATKNLEGY
jgi:hypothetical protein